MLVLGIETSCDETAMAIVDDKKNIRAHTIVSQIDVFKEFGGVIPEVASRNHLDVIDHVFEKVLADAELKAEQLDAIAVTIGPGLIGGLIVGTVFAKTLAVLLHKKLIAINHLEAHALTCRLTNDVEFPFMLLLISGGHCQVLEVYGVGQYKKICDTIDDALGECFDKVGQMINLEYPAGPKIEKFAPMGDENRFRFSKPLIDNSGKKRDESLKYNFSFSGLKTCVKYEVNKIQDLTDECRNDICASFQKTVVDILKNRLKNVFTSRNNFKFKNLVIAGGVSANQYIKNRLTDFCKTYGYNVITPPVKLCTDNGAMVAWAGMEHLLANFTTTYDDITISPKARWEL